MSIEPEYESSFRFIPEVSISDNEAAVQVCSDGSSRDSKGALAVAFSAPYSLIENAVIAQALVYGTCTSTRAEIRAAVQALKMIRAALPFLFDIPIIFMTDSGCGLGPWKGSKENPERGVWYARKPRKGWYKLSRSLSLSLSLSFARAILSLSLSVPTAESVGLAAVCVCMCMS